MKRERYLRTKKSPDVLENPNQSIYLLLQSLQWLELKPGQFDLDVFGNIWDKERQDELESQQSMLYKYTYIKKSQRIRIKEQVEAHQSTSSSMFI